MKILITGATGFIGRHLVESVVDIGWEVYISVRKTSNISWLDRSKVNIIEIDYTSSKTVIDSIQSYKTDLDKAPWDYVVHLMGVTKGSSYKTYYKVNTIYTQYLVKALDRDGYRPIRFLFMSSLASIGQPLMENMPLTGDQKSMPYNHYGRSKLLAEECVKYSGIDYCILLPTGVYGPGDKDYELIFKVMKRGFFLKTGISPQILTFVYVKDLIDAIILCLTTPVASKGRYVVSDGSKCSDIDLGTLLRKITGYSPVINIRIPMFIVWFVCFIGSIQAKLFGKLTPLNLDKYKMIAQRNWTCDISPIHNIGYNPKFSLERGMTYTFKSFLSDQNKKDKPKTRKT